uniref:RING finger protein 10 n=1 Tax=Rhizophora mucronata TaxID=61149 RepID=A0A2P2KWK0_RHIMU
MSILPTQSQGSNSSSSFNSDSLNPNSPNHGSAVDLLSSHLPRHFQSLQFSDPQSPPPASIAISGPVAPSGEDTVGTSQKVTDLGALNEEKSLSLEHGDPQFLSYSGGLEVGSTKCKGKTSEAIATQSRQTTGSINSQGGGTYSSGKRGQMTNANHLLNFHFDPIERPQSRPLPPIRRHRKIKPYNKDLFLQANYKFVVLDTGEYAHELMDPDKMLRWEDIVCVRYSTPFPVQCPICLEDPLCPQITSCGHIFCFPCILRYLLMGEKDYKGDCFKRCPLCFVMVSQKDLYTIYIENVKQYSVGDTIEFMLLTRQKDSFTPSQKNKQETDVMTSSCDDVNDPFSKFTFTSDVELSVRKAISDLDSWLRRADSGLVDDLDRLPYVCEAMEQLQMRQKYWNGLRACSSDRYEKYTSSQRGSQGILPTTNATSADREACSSRRPTPSFNVGDSIKLSSSNPESNSLQRPPNGFGDVNDKDFYNFYQAVDGQHLILHPLNMKCLLHHYGSYDMLPPRISGMILQLETITQSETTRRRYRFLSHFSLTTTFQLCEIDLSKMLPPDALFPFMDEIKKRKRQRQQLCRMEHKEKVKAEAAAASAAAAHSMLILSSSGQSSRDCTPNLSMDDFEGNS